MKVLICSLNSDSFLSLALGVSLALRERHHEVALVTDESCTQMIQTHGVDRIPRGTKDGPSFENSLWAQPLSVAIQVKHTEYAIDRFQPDVIVCQQLTLGPFVAAERRHVPLAVFGFFTYLWPLPPTSDNVGALGRCDDKERKLWRYKSHLNSLNEVRTLFRLAPLEVGLDDCGLLGDLFMLRSTADLEEAFAQLPPRVHLVGPCLWEGTERNPELDAWLSDAENLRHPIIYVHQGRFFDQPHFWPKVVDTFAGADVRIVAASAGMDCPVGDVPPNFFVRDRIPQATVLRRSTAMIASGNTTAVLGALTAGVPALLIPAGGEQPDVAERCKSVGVARVLQPSEVSIEQLKREVMSISTDVVMRANLNRISSSFARANTFHRAADLIESLGETRRPVFRADNAKLALQQTV